jgi:hypothetical protein
VRGHPATSHTGSDSSRVPPVSTIEANPGPRHPVQEIKILPTSCERPG